MAPGGGNRGATSVSSVVRAALPRPWRLSLPPTRLPMPKLGRGGASHMNSGGVPAGTGSGNARSRGGSAAGVGEFGSGGDGGDCGAGRISVDGISGAAFSGAGVTGTGRDAELGTVGRPRRGADGRRLARSRGSRRAFGRRRADTAGCVRRVGSGAPEFASPPAGACSFTGSSMSSTASAVASTIAAAAQTARGKRMPDRGRLPCVAVCGRFCPRTCLARRCAATADRVRAAYARWHGSRRARASPMPRPATGRCWPARASRWVRGCSRVGRASRYW